MAETAKGAMLVELRNLINNRSHRLEAYLRAKANVESTREKIDAIKSSLGARNSPFDKIDLELAEEKLEREIIELESSTFLTDCERQKELEDAIFKIENEEMERGRDHEIQMALFEQKTAEMQLETARLAAEMNIKAQEQSKQSIDTLLKEVTGNGSSEDS